MQKIGSLESMLPRIGKASGHFKIDAKKEPFGVLGKEKSAGPSSFSEYLQDAIGEVNQVQKQADTKASDVASGRSTNIHEAMLAASHAQLSFNLMVQVRNKALEAYQEVMRMPV